MFWVQLLWRICYQLMSGVPFHNALNNPLQNPSFVRNMNALIVLNAPQCFETFKTKLQLSLLDTLLLDSGCSQCLARNLLLCSVSFGATGVKPVALSPQFFAFADTVVAKAYDRDNECHGWLGIKYQSAPGYVPPPSEW